jgi:hypothetical protein
MEPEVSSQCLQEPATDSSWARWIQSTTSYSIFLRSILIFSFHLRVCLSSCDVSIRVLYAFLISPMCATCPAYLILLNSVILIINMWWRVQIMKLLIIEFPPAIVQSVYRLTTGWTNGWSGFESRRGAGNFCFRHRVQTGSGAHTVSYPMGTEGFFPGGKVAGAWSWPFTSS